jgi:serine/threonine protein kinase
MLHGLEYTHERRVAHRDPKPENLLWDDTERHVVKLAAFGFAKRCKTHNGLRTLCGTPGYLAPEILERWPAYDIKCDLWSVGVILIFIVGGIFTL